MEDRAAVCADCLFLTTGKALTNHQGHWFLCMNWLFSITQHSMFQEQLNDFKVPVKSQYLITQISLRSRVRADGCAFTSLIQVNVCLSQRAGKGMGVLPQSISGIHWISTHHSLFNVLSDMLWQAAAGVSACRRVKRWSLNRTNASLMLCCH